MSWDPYNIPATFNGQHAPGAKRPLSELEKDVVNIESTMRDTVRTVNIVHKISIIGRNPKEYHMLKISIRLYYFSQFLRL